MAPRRSRKNRPAARRTSRKLSKSVSAPVKKFVKRAINANAETKYVASPPYNNASGILVNTSFTAGITSNAECYALIPPVVQGDGDHQRIGNTIKPTSLKVKGFVSLISNQADSFYIDVDVWILTSKTLKSQFQESSLDMASLLNKGDGTNTSYDGSFLNSIYPINTALFTVLKHKRVRLTKPFGNMNTAICGGDPINAANYSSEKYSAVLNMKVPMPKMLKYNLDAETVAANYYPFMVIGYNCPSNCDASSVGNLNTIRATFDSQMYFKDS